MSTGANHHASVVAFGPRCGVLILGPSGAGKSRLALRLIDAGAQLVADDQALLIQSDGALFARPPRSIAGQLEMRGLGILSLPYRRLARLSLAVDLAASTPARLPAPERRVISGVALPCVAGQADAAFPAALARYVGRIRDTE